MSIQAMLPFERLPCDRFSQFFDGVFVVTTQLFKGGADKKIIGALNIDLLFGAFSSDLQSIFVVGRCFVLVVTTADPCLLVT